MAFDNQGQTPTSLEDLLKENIRTNQEILESVNFLKNYFRWQVIANSVKIFLIAAAIVLGILSVNSIIGRFAGGWSGLSSPASLLNGIEELSN